VLDGITENEQVILDPLAHIPDAQLDAAAAMRANGEQKFGFDDL